MQTNNNAIQQAINRAEQRKQCIPSPRKGNLILTSKFYNCYEIDMIQENKSNFITNTLLKISLGTVTK
jgi:hypothetical protein